MPTTSTLMPELDAALSAAATRRLKPAGQRRRRGARPIGFGVLAVVVAAGAAVASGLPGALTPEQRAAQQQTARASTALLETLPRVRTAELPADLRQLHHIAASGPLAQLGWRIPGSPAGYLFTSADGDYCLLRASGASCTALERLSPTLELGYERDRDRTSLTVLALGEVDALQITMEDGRELRLAVPTGSSHHELSGRVRAARWTLRGQPFGLAVPGDALTPSGAR